MSEIKPTIPMILTLLQSEYPNSFGNMDNRTMKLKLQLWETEFEHDDIELVYAAVRLYMKKPERFAPSIGQIREAMRSLTQTQAKEPELTDQDAWALVSKACSNGLYGYKEEFVKLPLEVQRAVGAPEQLREWAKMDVETVQSVVASNFKKTFRADRERQKQLELISEDIRRMITGVSDRVSLPGK